MLHRWMGTAEVQGVKGNIGVMQCFESVLQRFRRCCGDAGYCRGEGFCGGNKGVALELRGCLSGAGGTVEVTRMLPLDFCTVKILAFGQSEN